MKQTEEELVRFLKEEDANSFTDRLQRLRFLVEMFGEPGHLLLHGELSPLAPSTDYHSAIFCNSSFELIPNETTIPTKSTCRQTNFLTERFV